MIEGAILDWNRTLVKGEKSPAEFYPEAISVLQQLRDRGLRMGIVSAGGKDPSQRWRDFEELNVRSLGVTEFQVVGSTEPKNLMLMAQSLGIKPENCIVVGDSLSKEIQEGNEMGAVTYRVRRPGDKFANDIPDKKEQEPTYTRDSLQDLPQIIDEINSRN